MERESSFECSLFFLSTKESCWLWNRPSRNSTMFSSRRSAKCPVLKFNKGSEGFFTLWSRKLRFTNCICRYTCFTKRGKPFKVVVKQEIKKVLANKENAFTLSIERLNLVVLYHVTRWFGRQNLLYSGELICWRLSEEHTFQSRHYTTRRCLSRQISSFSLSLFRWVTYILLNGWLDSIVQCYQAFSH